MQRPVKVVWKVGEGGTRCRDGHRVGRTADPRTLRGEGLGLRGGCVPCPPAPEAGRRGGGLLTSCQAWDTQRVQALLAT